MQDVVVFEEKDEAFYVGVGKSRSENIIYISSGKAAVTGCTSWAGSQGAV